MPGAPYLDFEMWASSARETVFLPPPKIVISADCIYYFELDGEFEIEDNEAKQVTCMQEMIADKTPSISAKTRSSPAI